MAYPWNFLQGDSELARVVGRDVTAESLVKR